MSTHSLSSWTFDLGLDPSGGKQQKFLDCFWPSHSIGSQRRSQIEAPLTGSDRAFRSSRGHNPSERPSHKSKPWRVWPCSTWRLRPGRRWLPSFFGGTPGHFFGPLMLRHTWKTHIWQWSTFRGSHRSFAAYGVRSKRSTSPIACGRGGMGGLPKCSPTKQGSICCSMSASSQLPWQKHLGSWL